jgi:glutamate---cysteine ligase / carboxylate-amine ligase
MLLARSDHSLAQCSDAALAQLTSELSAHTAPETHAAVVELATGVHLDAPATVAELRILRERLALELRSLDLVPACAGMHPLASAEASRVSGSQRYKLIAESMRWLAHREPTMALHVHVGIPDPQDAVRVLNHLREHLSMLLALASNSPFSQGRDTGFASARTVIFGGFPRTGTPRLFAGYGEYVEAVDTLIASGAIPDHTFLWWDIRLQPTLGTVEVRVMDAQSEVGQTASLIALIQSLARMALEGEAAGGATSPEVLAENRFLAARDGLDARLIDSADRKLVPVQTMVQSLLERLRPHGAALGCSDELDRLERLALVNGAAHQRRWVRRGGDFVSLISTLAEQFTAG